jgi:3-dehydroquinate synthase
LVRHEGGRYAVVVRSGACADLPALVAERHPGARIAVIADADVVAILGSPIAGAETITFAAGEASKSRATWAGLTDQLLAARFDRHSVIVAFGGGVTTDLAGFVAATYLRGVPWIAVPTTTLSMLDAAIGGKTGVDTPHGKNLVGAFHPPTAVVCDPALLTTLPDRRFREGLAEAVKHGVILDARYAEWIMANAAAILQRDQTVLAQLIRRSVEIKAEVVMADEHEGDRRAVLNAGHTVAHALERATDYAVPHGEAVAIGLVTETRIAEQGSIAAAGTADYITTLCAALGLPTALPAGVSAAALVDGMQSDKKNRDGVVQAAFVASVGKPAPLDGGWTRPLDLDLLRALLAS